MRKVGLEEASIQVWSAADRPRVLLLGGDGLVSMHDLPKETAQLSRTHKEEKAREVPEKKQHWMPSQGEERANLNTKTGTHTETAGAGHEHGRPTARAMADEAGGWVLEPAPWMARWWCGRSGGVSRGAGVEPALGPVVQEIRRSGGVGHRRQWRRVPGPRARRGDARRSCYLGSRWRSVGVDYSREAEEISSARRRVMEKCQRRSWFLLDQPTCEAS